MSGKSTAAKVLITLAAISVLAAWSTATVVINATAQDCFNGSTVPIGNLGISVFQVSKARKLMTQLKSMDQEHFLPRDDRAMARFDTLYTKMVSLATSTNALARGTTASNGTVAFTVAAVDSVLVLGYGDVEDEAYYWSYKTIRGLSNASVALDMSRGSCNR